MRVVSRRQYQPRLARLAESAAVETALSDWAMSKGAAAPTTWTRRFARFEAGRQPWATLVYETVGPKQQLVTIRAFDESEAPAGCADFGAGPTTVSSFLDDPGLPSLAAVFARHPDANVVRYRPGQRCTARVGGMQEPRFVKVFADAATAERLHAEAEDLWRAYRSGELGFVVAEPDRYEPSLGALWQHVVPGQPIVDRLGSRGDTVSYGGVELCRRLGAALGSLALSSVKPTGTITTEHQWTRTYRALAKARALGGSVAARVERCAERLETAHSAEIDSPMLVVHGSPHMHQWLDHNGQLGLVDFDRLARGHVELDAATFLAELDFESSLRARVEDFEIAMIEGYADAGVTLDASLVARYRVHKWMAKLGRTTEAIRPGGDEKVARVLDRIESFLES